jgi:hypothetical protein
MINLPRFFNKKTKMRNEINQKPHQVLWIGCAVLLGFSMIISCGAINLQISDAVHSTQVQELTLQIVIYLGFLGFVYSSALKSGKKLNKLMTMLHIAFSLFGAVTFVFMACETGETVNPFGKTGASGSRLFLWLVLAFLFAQIVFLINIGKAFFIKSSAL